MVEEVIVQNPKYFNLVFFSFRLTGIILNNKTLLIKLNKTCGCESQNRDKVSPVSAMKAYEKSGITNPLIFTFDKQPPAPMEQEDGWAQVAVCRREKSLARAENRKTIPRSSSPQPNHCINYAILPPYIECYYITSNILNKDPK